MAALRPRDEFDSPPAEVIEQERVRTAGGHFNVIHNESMQCADVYVAGADELSVWGLQHRVIRQVEGEQVQFERTWTDRRSKAGLPGCILAANGRQRSHILTMSDV